MDTRAARRTAEKAARDLINNRATLVGELGVAQAERTQLHDDVTVAADRGRQLVAAAEAEAARLLGHAQTAVRDADHRYADAYSAATAAGWASADLTALGFQPADSTSPPRRRSTVGRPAPTPTAAHPDVPQQHSPSTGTAATPPTNPPSQNT